MITIKEIAWLAGLLEGEGCFKLNGNSASIQLNMTDEDTVKKASKLFKRPYYENKTPERIGHKRLYYVNIMGTPAVEWMLTIYSLMSYRRQAKILEILNIWKKTETVKKYSFGCGHPKTSNNIRPNGKYKTCLICASKRSREWYLKNKVMETPRVE